MRPEAASGTIPARGFDWEEVRFAARRIGEVVDLRYGKALVERNRQPGTVPMFGTNGRCGWHDTPLAAGPGVILGRKGQGHLGVKWCDSDFWVIDTAYYAEPDRSEVDLRWFYYITKYVGLDHLKTGEKPGLSRDIFGRQLFPFPLLEEQRAIARVLGALDDKIEANRALNETLEATCQALFRSWFVDFDPVVAKSEGRPPAHLTADVAALFPDRFEDSPVGPVPAGWEPTTVGPVLAIYDSKRVPLSGAQRARRPGPFPYYGAASVMDHIDDYLFDGIYLLVGEDGSVVREDGRAVTQYVWGKLWVNNHAHVLQGVDPICTEHLLLHFRQELITPFVTGAVQPKINQANLKSVPFIMPSAEVARCFARTIGPFFAKLRQGTEESQSLTALRDALLPRLLSGELRVRQAEQLVEEAI